MQFISSFYKLIFLLIVFLKNLIQKMIEFIDEKILIKLNINKSILFINENSHIIMSERFIIEIN
jgi:hypothetical protein